MVSLLDTSNARLGWWLVVAGLALLLATVLEQVLGTAVFGWYGPFLGPLVLVVAVQTTRLVLPELPAGDRLTPSTVASSLGSDPE